MYYYLDKDMIVEKKAQSAWIRRKRKELVQRFGDGCNTCGGREQLHFHHIKPTLLSGKGRGSPQRYYDVVKNPKSYLLMCRSCHKEFHYKLKYS